MDKCGGLSSLAGIPLVECLFTLHAPLEEVEQILLSLHDAAAQFRGRDTVVEVFTLPENLVVKRRY